MTLRDYSSTAQNDTADENPGNSSSDNLADALQSNIINAFEAAIDQGLRPTDALAVILSWMSSEMMRIPGKPAAFEPSF